MDIIRVSIEKLANSVSRGEIEIYNEFSAQHELGMILRSEAGKGMKVQFERPVNFFGFEKEKFEKREMDISIYSPDKEIISTIELKFPRSGQHPEQMFKACQDILFLEQLVRAGFQTSYFLMFADDPLFYERGIKTGIFGFFRSGDTLTGKIKKPTGAKDHEVLISGKYIIDWKAVNEPLKYFVLEIAGL